jgi:hypothetical protein
VFKELSIHEYRGSRRHGNHTYMNAADRERWHLKVLADRDAYWAKQKKAP